MPVPSSSESAFEHDLLLAILRDLYHRLSCVRVLDHSPQGDLQKDVSPVCPCTAILAAVFSVTCLEVTLEFVMQEGPEAVIAPDNHVASAPPVSPVGTAFWDVLFPSEMGRALTPIPGRYVHLYIIHKIAFGHRVLLKLLNVRSRKILIPEGKRRIKPGFR